MEKLGARWDIVDTEGGKSVMYENLVAGVQFNCGICPATTTVPMLLEFILTEGDAGDIVFLNGSVIWIQAEVRT